jgi:tetratricopeptide (TPR) repeat protein
MGVASMGSIELQTARDLRNSHIGSPDYCENYYRAIDFVERLNALSARAHQEGHDDWSARLGWESADLSSTISASIPDDLNSPNEDDAFYGPQPDREEEENKAADDPCPQRAAAATAPDDTEPVQTVSGPYDFPHDRKSPSGALLNSAMAEMRAGQFDGALANLRKIEAANPYMAQAFFLEGRILNRQGHFREALRQLKQAEALGCTQGRLPLDIGRSLVMLDQPKQALAEIAIFDRDYPGSPLASGLKGHALLDLGDLDNAGKYLADSMHDPRLRPMALLYLAVIEHKRGNDAGARKLFSNALAADSKSPFSQSFRRALSRLAKANADGRSYRDEGAISGLAFDVGGILSFAGASKHHGNTKSHNNDRSPAAPSDISRNHSTSPSETDTSDSPGTKLPVPHDRPTSADARNSDRGGAVSVGGIVADETVPHYPQPEGDFFDMFVIMAGGDEIWDRCRDLPLESEPPTDDVQEVKGDLGTITVAM